MKHQWLGSWVQGLPLLRDQRGVVGFEYLLLIGVVVVAFAAAIILGAKQIVPQVVGQTCSGADTADLAVEDGDFEIVVVVAPPAAVPCEDEDTMVVAE